MAEPMHNKRRELMAELLGYSLGIADEESQARVEAAYPDRQALRSACEAVRRRLAPLDADRPVRVPKDLVAGIRDRIAGVGSVIPISRGSAAERSAGRGTEGGSARAAGSERRAAATAPVSGQVLARRRGGLEPVGADRGAGGGPILVLREIVGLAAAILVFVGIVVPGYRTARSAAQRIACAGHLRSVGEGYAAYADTYGSRWPYAGVLPTGASWLPTETSGPGNSRHVYQLVRRRLAPPEAFICPGRPGDAAMIAGRLETLDNFPDARNNSYTTNLVTRPGRRGEFTAEMPIVADMTPLLDQQRRLRPAGAVMPNSDSHGRSVGQNVVRADLSIQFFRNPRVGADGDDIYRLVGVQEYTGLERPRLQSDAFLVP